MAKRRTHKEKQQAQTRRRQRVETAPQEPTVLRQAPLSPSTTKATKGVLRVDQALLKRDILKTVLITVLLLAGISGIFIYLQ